MKAGLTWKGRSLAVLAAAFGIAAAMPTVSTPAVAQDIEASIARGGQLYDKWYKVNKATPPKQSHTAYPSAGKYAAKPGTNWRCKECHGWDAKGKDGAYAKGKHYTGIKGIGSYAGAEPAAIIAILTGPLHGFTGAMMSERDLEDVALFVSKGTVDMDRYIDRSTRKSKGDKAKGAAYYDTVCAKCHGLTGVKIREMEPMGAAANGNPWEVLHKILNGQPDERMPALRAFDRQIAADILAYIQTLPQRR